MYSKTITLRPNGSLTLPKKIRSKHKTIHYIMMEVPQGVLLKPIEEIEYYEEADGSFGLRFPNGIDAGKLATMMGTAMKELEKEGHWDKKKKKKSTRSARG